MAIEERMCLDENQAKRLSVFSENLFATSWFKYPQILHNRGYLLIHQPRAIKAWNSDTLVQERTYPDFEVIHQNKCRQVLLEVTQSMWNQDFSGSHKEVQLRVLNDYHQRNPNCIPLLLTWEAITHPLWSLTLIHKVAEGQLNYDGAYEEMDQSIRQDRYCI
jgi:hypothetical protein